MPVILAIDSSTEACSCALNIEGEVFERFDILPRQHANCLLPMIADLMAEHSLKYADLSAIAVGRGPGSFTGLRIAAGVAQGIAFGADLKIVPVSTLATLALQARSFSDSKYVLSCLDARIKEVYWGVFQFSDTEPVLLGEERLCKPELIPEMALEASKTWYGLGNGMEFFDQMSTDVTNKITAYSADIYPHAADVASLASLYFDRGLAVEAHELSPSYIRDKVTST